MQLLELASVPRNHTELRVPKTLVSLSLGSSPDGPQTEVLAVKELSLVRLHLGTNPKQPHTQTKNQLPTILGRFKLRVLPGPYTPC